MGKYRIWGHQQRQQVNLDENQVRKIRFELLPPKEDGGQGLSVADVANIYGVCRETIRRIGRRETWAHVTPTALDMPLQEVTELTPEQKERAARASAAIARMLESDKPKEGA